MAALTEEQTLLKEQAASWARDEAPVAKFREMRDSGNELGFDKATWEAIGELGWAGIVVPEEYGQQLVRPVYGDPFLHTELGLGSGGTSLGGLMQRAAVSTSVVASAATGSVTPAGDSLLPQPADTTAMVATSEILKIRME